uniref:Uncharacterized protein n=1 Tax=viral metagenome TaxID=1070528 RepID=A0A6M3LIQ3_9ZZZZ
MGKEKEKKMRKEKEKENKMKISVGDYDDCDVQTIQNVETEDTVSNKDILNKIITSIYKDEYGIIVFEIEDKYNFEKFMEEIKNWSEEEFIKELKITVDRLDSLLKESNTRNISISLCIHHGKHDVHKGITLWSITKSLI